MPESFSWLAECLCEARSKGGLGKFERGVLKTMLMLAAVDGNVSASEIDAFRAMALESSGITGEAFAELWRDALHSAGYLALQAKLLRKDLLVAEFMREAEDVFVKAVASEPRSKWTKVFDGLNGIASADGDYSDVERECVNALVKRVCEVSKSGDVK